VHKLLILSLLLISTLVLAEDPHHEVEPTTVVYETTTIVETSNTEAAVIAAAMSQHHFSYGTYAYQKSIAAATIDNEVAFSFAMAHRDCRDCGMFSASISAVRLDTVAIGAGYTWSY